MEKIATSLMLLSGCMLATIQIRGIIKGRFPMFGFSKLDPISDNLQPFPKTVIPEEILIGNPAFKAETGSPIKAFGDDNLVS